jgi:hypothetical protein
MFPHTPMCYYMLVYIYIYVLQTLNIVIYISKIDVYVVLNTNNKRQYNNQ